MTATGSIGFAEAAMEFYVGLEADNSRAYWQAHKADYDTHVRAPMEALLGELDAEFGPFKIFRPYQDRRFATNRPPYKTHIGAYGESEAGAGYYVQFSSAGLMVAAGYYTMAPDQLERFRTAVADDHRGEELAALAAAAQGRGDRLMALSELKTAPRGYAKDHPRVALLRRKGLAVTRSWTPAPWLATARVGSKVTGAWHDMAPLVSWLDTHVGPSTMMPEDFDTV